MKKDETRRPSVTLADQPPATRLAYYSGMRSLGAITINEIRAAEGLHSVGPLGDVFPVVDPEPIVITSKVFREETDDQ